jgi:hypothetical protein
MGWSTSTAVKEIKASRVFDGPFVLLILDLLLVACYFILVRRVDAYDKNGVFQASAAVELFWVMVIFGGYVLWDLLTRVLLPREHAENPLWSIIAAACAVALYFSLRGTSSFHGITLVDVALVTFVLAYRGAKEGSWLWSLLMALASVGIAIAAGYHH